jgi:hypothetical protein
VKLDDIERELYEKAGALLLDARLLRRLVKAHRRATGLVPHGRCYALARDDLVRLAQSGELGDAPEVGRLRQDGLPGDVVLVARPGPRTLERVGRETLATELWRGVFHGRVHLALDRLELDDASVRKRIDRIGQTEFDEVRAILRHDEHLLPPYDARTAFEEFAALYLELRHFAPALLRVTFPGIDDLDAVDELLGEDLDAGPLVTEGRPAGVVLPEPASTPRAPSTGPRSMPALIAALDAAPAKPPSHAAFKRLLKAAERERRRGNHVGAALRAARAACIEDRAEQRLADAARRADLAALAERLEQAVSAGAADDRSATAAAWRPLLGLLTDTAARRGGLRTSREARLLYGLQSAALAHERPPRSIDLPAWLLSRGARPAMRALGATRELRVARELRGVARKASGVRLAPADRKLLARQIAAAVERAELHARLALRPRLAGALEHAGLRPRSAAEHTGRDKLVEELLDEVVQRGFFSFASLRDALSRNELKLDDLGGPRALWEGDALLRADRELSVTLEGVYRRGEIYLRGLQKLSSLPFGTRLGRGLTLYLLLPFGAAYVLLEAAGQLLGPLFGVRLALVRPWPFALTATVLFGLLHSEAFRVAARQLLDLMALVVVTLLVRLPRAVLALPVLQRFFAQPLVRSLARRLIVPGAATLALWWLAPRHRLDPWLAAGGALTTFALASLALGSRLGGWLAQTLVEQLAPTWQVLSRQLVPGLLRALGRFFAMMLELLERTLYRVHESLRYRDGDARAILWAKATLALLWAPLAYVLRMYATLLVEPEINPLKHFPVVTVAHKLMLPLLPALLAALERPMSAAFGGIAGGALAAITVFLLPSVFGFFAWELKENYKLYRACRPPVLRAASIGPSGETMRALLVPGLHSGTLPKLHGRMRRAAQLADDEARRAGGAASRRRTLAGDAALARLREALSAIEGTVRRFVERELVAALAASPRWHLGALAVERVDLSSNRVRLRLACPALAPEPASEVTFEHQSGWVVAGMAQAGFVARLEGDERLLFETALAGLYQRAEVDLVREQLAREIGDTVPYDVADEGLLVWPGGDFRTELVYALEVRLRPGAVAARVRGRAPPSAPPPLDLRRVLWREQAIGWVGWEAFWAAAAEHGATLPQLARGASLLPPREHG